MAAQKEKLTRVLYPKETSACIDQELGCSWKSRMLNKTITGIYVDRYRYCIVGTPFGIDWKGARQFMRICHSGADRQSISDFD